MATATKTLSDKIREESFSDGFTDGFTDGKKNKSIEIAKNMLRKEFPIDVISDCTGLTAEELQELEKEL